MRPGRSASHGPSVVHALALTVLLTGCAGGADDGGRPFRSSPAPRTTPAQELCASVISHWAGEILSGREIHLDYQAMGLSNGQNEILLAVIDAARTAQKTQSPEEVRRLADRLISRRCEERYRDGTPTAGPWS